MNFLAKDAAQKLMVFAKIVYLNVTRAGGYGDGLRITEKKVGSISFQTPFLGRPFYENPSKEDIKDGTKI